MTIPRETEPLQADDSSSSTTSTAHDTQGWDIQPLVGKGKGIEDCYVPRPRRGASAVYYKYNFANTNTSSSCITSECKSTSAKRTLEKCCNHYAPVASNLWKNKTSKMSLNSIQPSTSPSDSSSAEFEAFMDDLLKLHLKSFDDSCLQAQRSPASGFDLFAFISRSTSSSVSPSNTATSICDIHIEQHAFYCETCAVAICNNCNTSLHSQHSMINFQEAVDKATALNVQLQNEIEAVMQTILEAIDKAKEMNNRVQFKLKTAMNDVNETVRRFHHLLMKRTEELVGDLGRILNHKNSQLHAQIDNFNTINEGAWMINRTIRNSLESNSPLDIIIQTQKASREMATIRSLMTIPLEPCENDQVSFVATDDGKLRNVIANMGTIRGHPNARYVSNQTTTSCIPQPILMGERLQMSSSSTSRDLVQDRSSYGHLQTARKWWPSLTTDSTPSSGFPMGLKLSPPNTSRFPFIESTRSASPERLTFSPPERLRCSPETSSAFSALGDCSLFSQPQQYPDTIQLFSLSAPIIVKKTSGLPSLTIGGEGVEDGRFCRPWGLCCTKNYDIIVADRSNNRIQVFNSRGRFLFKFGERGTGPGQFDRPAGICQTPKGKIVVVDKDNHRIQIFETDGRHITTFGKKGSENGQFNYPWDVACNSNGHIAVTDTRNHRIQVFDENGVFLKKFGYGNNGTSNAWKNFDSPRGICFNPDGDLFVTDFNNHRLVKINQSLTSAKFIGEEGAHARGFRRPQGIVCDDVGNIIVADSRNNRIQVFDKLGSFIWAIGKYNNEPGFLPGEFDRPSGICLSPDGRIMLVDYGNNRIQVF